MSPQRDCFPQSSFTPCDNITDMASTPEEMTPWLLHSWGKECWLLVSDTQSHDAVQPNLLLLGLIFQCKSRSLTKIIGSFPVCSLEGTLQWVARLYGLWSSSFSNHVWIVNECLVGQDALSLIPLSFCVFPLSSQTPSHLDRRFSSLWAAVFLFLGHEQTSLSHCRKFCFVLFLACVTSWVELYFFLSASVRCRYATSTSPVSLLAVCACCCDVARQQGGAADPFMCYNCTAAQSVSILIFRLICDTEQTWAPESCTEPQSFGSYLDHEANMRYCALSRCVQGLQGTCKSKLRSEYASVAMTNVNCDECSSKAKIWKELLSLCFLMCSSSVVHRIFCCHGCIYSRTTHDRNIIWLNFGASQCIHLHIHEFCFLFFSSWNYK